jgi:cytochrome oxidase assembly protein ShyY1
VPRRVVVLTLVVALIVPAMVLLGRWQWHRHEDRREANAEALAGMSAPPAPVDQVLPAVPVDAARTTAAAHDGTLPLPPEQEVRTVTATGRYDAAGTQLVRRRSYPDRGTGFEVVVPLLTDSGSTLLVVRGWVPNATTAAGAPDVPPPPSGPVTVTGRLRAGEAPRPATDLPPQQVWRIDVPALADGTSVSAARPVVPAYVEATDEQPEPGPDPAGILRMPPPELDAGPHQMYAYQWWIFATIAFGGWALLMRTELVDHRRRRAAREADEEVPTPTA